MSRVRKLGRRVGITTLNSTTTNAVKDSGLDNVKALDTSAALAGHRLCENGHHDLRALSAPGGRTSQLWGQLALRNCLRQAYHDTRGGSCTSTGGVNDRGEPNMVLP